MRMRRTSRGRTPHVRSCGLAICAVLFFASIARAHPAGLSVLTIQIEDQRVRTEMVLPMHGMPLLYPPTPGQSDESYAAWAAGQLEKDAADVLEVRINYAPVSANRAKARAEGADSVVLEMEFSAATPTAGPITTLQVFSNRVPKLGEGHRQL